MFQGFSNETVDFMWGIRFNNEKAWFEEHRQVYLERFYEPMRQLGSEVYDHLSPQLKGCALTCKVSRIYRDARRLFGRGPYKDHLWFSVQQPATAQESAPCFWFELGPETWGYGLGYYMAEPVIMAKLRARISADPKPMETLTRRLSRSGEFTLEGAAYKRPKPGAPSELLSPWYGLKNFSLSHDEPLSDQLFSRELAQRLKTGFDFLIPYYRYVVTLPGDPDPRGQ